MSTQKIHGDEAQRAEASDIPRERRHFKELLLANHFKPVVSPEGEPPAGNTTYEELVYVGYRPLLKRLDAVVEIKLANGYSGDICTAGSTEYVRFFASTDDGASWSDLGTTSFTTWDVSGPKPLQFDVTLPVDLVAHCCKDTNLVLIRAILSWQVPPGGPTDPVVWGNGLDAEVQVAPIALGTLENLLQCLELPFDAGELSELVNLEQIVEFANGTELTALQLHELYRDTEVPQHRYLLKRMTQLLADPIALGAAASQSDLELVAGLGGKVNIGALIGALLDPQGDETFEQLGCIGLNTTTDELVATIDVKLSSGYSGDLCTNGSHEYVAFWVDWGSGYQYVGTTSVNVHDITSIPASGIQYSASLPFSQALTLRQPCTDGPLTPQIRAVLSWEALPSDIDPYAVPVWGGHLETNVLIPPGEPLLGGGPVLESIGSMPVALIDQVTGLATGMSLVGFSASACPFGGQINFSGHVVNPSTALFGGPGFQYRILVSTNGGASYTPMTDPFVVETTTFPAVVFNSVSQIPDPVEGWCNYLEVSGLVDVVGNILGFFETSGNAGLWISMEARQGATSLGATPWTLIALDNAAPSPVAVAITSGAGSCGDFQPGDSISGTYSGADNEDLRGVSISVEMAMPGATLTQTTTTQTLTSESGTWTLQTLATTQPCGYTITATATDNTIVNSGTIGFETQAFTGLCLRPPA